MTTIETTSTDRLVALRSIRKAELNRLNRNISVASHASTTEVKSPVKIEKQVDLQWLHRRQHNGPTSEDTSVLYFPDPVVNFDLHLSEAKTQQQTTHTPPFAGEIDPSSQLPRYVLSVETNRLFGEVGLSSTEEMYPELVSHLKTAQTKHLTAYY